MPTLPWNIDLKPAFPGIALEITHDYETGETVLSVTNKSAEPVRPGRLSFVSALPLKASGASLWLHGRFMQEDALVRVLGTPPEEGYEGRYRRMSEGGNTYLSHEVVVIRSPPRASQGSWLAASNPADSSSIASSMLIQTRWRFALSPSNSTSKERWRSRRGKRWCCPHCSSAKGRMPWT